MFKKSVIAYLSVLTLTVLLSGCTEDDTFPITPEIEFKTLEIFTNVSGSDSLVLTFSFTDGDGDLGTPSDDQTNSDIFVRLFEMQNGVFVEPPLAAPLEYRMPFLKPRGNNKSLKGDVKINIDYNVLQPNDTIYYLLYIKDRAGHKSNEITSSTIITNAD